MNRNLSKTQSPIIFLVNGSVLGNHLSSLIEDLTKCLPDCEFKQVDQKLEATNPSKFPNNNIFLVLNIEDRNFGV